MAADGGRAGGRRPRRLDRGRATLPGRADRRAHHASGGAPAHRTGAIRHPGLVAGDQCPHPSEPAGGLGGSTSRKPGWSAWAVPAPIPKSTGRLRNRLSRPGRCIPRSAVTAWPSNCWRSARTSLRRSSVFPTCTAFWLRSMDRRKAVKEADRSHFMTAMIDRAVTEKRAGKEELTVWGAPDTVRDLLYVDDQIAAVLAAERQFATCW